jgi:hypothetical protein
MFVCLAFHLLRKASVELWRHEKNLPLVFVQIVMELGNTFMLVALSGFATSATATGR